MTALRRESASRAGLVAALSLGLSSCGSAANSLTGSLDEIAPLQFDAVVVRASPDVLVIEYDRAPPPVVTGPSDGGSDATDVDAGTAGTDVVFKLEMKIESLTLASGLDEDLTSRLNDGSARVSCTRAVGTDPRRVFPPIQRGDLALDSDVAIGGTASGHFHILFGEGGEIGEGRTVDGSFQGTVQNADPGSQP